MLAVLRRRCGWLEPDEREVAFHDSYMVLLEKGRAGELDPERMHPKEVRAYLTQTAIYKALDEGKRAERKRSVPMTDEVLAAPDDRETPEDLAATGLDNARIQEVLSELPSRRQVIVKLRFFFDRTPAEIQRHLGITERVYRRELERALKQIVDGVELVRNDRFCDTRRSLILAYVAGVAGPTRIRQARAHLATCPGCAHWAATMREAANRAAALIPLPVVVRDDAGLVAWLVDVLSNARDFVVDVITGAKHHAVSLLTRLDPGAAGYAAGARPGAAAMAVAGCLAVGTGATYCAVAGLPAPVRKLVTSEKPKQRAPARKAPAKRLPRPTATPRLPLPPPVTPRAAHDPPTASRGSNRKTAPKPGRTKPVSPARQEAVAVQQEFGPAGTPPAAPPATAPAPPAPPPRAPGEFDP